MTGERVLVISDVHLLSDNCQAELLLVTLRERKYETLLIVGDLVEDDRPIVYGLGMDPHQLEVVEYLRQMLNGGGSAKNIVRVGGNHDPKADFISQVLGVKTQKEYRWEIGGRKFCAIHGHQFDGFIFTSPFWDRIISAIFLTLQRFDTRKKFWTRMIEKICVRWSKIAEAVAKGAREFARRKGLDVVICGHSHKAEKLTFEDKGRTVEYYNCGGWTGDQCSFVTIDADGLVEIHKVSPDADV